MTSHSKVDNADTILDAKIRRALALGITILLGVTAIAVNWLPGIDEASARWISGSLLKLTLVVGAIWLAFPKIEAIRRMRGGGAILTSGLVLVAVFIIRPKLLIYAVPLAFTATAILVSLGWFSKRSS